MRAFAPIPFPIDWSLRDLSENVSNRQNWTKQTQYWYSQKLEKLASKVYACKYKGFWRVACEHLNILYLYKNGNVALVKL